MKNLNRIQSLCALTFALTLGACGGKSESKPKVNNQTPTSQIGATAAEFKGVWVSKCQNQLMSKFSFDGDRFTLRDDYYYDDACNDYDTTYEFSGTFVIGQANPKTPGSFELDLNLDDPTRYGHSKYMGIFELQNGVLTISGLDAEQRPTTFDTIGGVFTREDAGGGNALRVNGSVAGRWGEAPLTNDKN